MEDHSVRPFAAIRQYLEAIFVLYKFAQHFVSLVRFRHAPSPPTNGGEGGERRIIDPTRKLPNPLPVRASRREEDYQAFLEGVPNSMAVPPQQLVNFRVA